MLLLGVVDGTDLNRAEALASTAAAAGSAYGRYCLAWIRYEQHRLEESFDLMTQAAGRDFVPAMMDLGRFYASGIGTTRDLRKAERHFRSSSDKGHRLSTVFLLQLWAKGACGPLKSITARVLLPVLHRYAAWHVARHYFEEIGLAYNPPWLQK